MSEFRYHRLSNRWVIIAPERATRPGLNPPEPIVESESPFAWGNESLTPPEIDALRPEGSKPNTPDWRIRVVPNKYRALSIESEPRAKTDGCHEAWGGFGAHEVIIDQPDPNLRPHAYSVTQWRELLAMLQRRLRNLDSDPHMAYVQLFKNEGRSAGATISHPHMQLLGLPMIPRAVQEEIERAREHYFRTRRCLLLDEVHAELSESVRTIFENRTFGVFCPYASAFPFQLSIASKSLLEPFQAVNDLVITELADAILFALERLERVEPYLPYNLIFKIAPFLRAHPNPGYFHQIEQFYPWRVEILPRLYNLAGFELGTGMAINPIAPEEAAEFLRDCLA